MRTIITGLISIHLFFLNSSGANPSKKWEDAILRKNIKSVKLYKKGWDLSYPTIELGNEDKLILEFDELGDEKHEYSYTFIHCNADWTPSSISQSQYLEGFYMNPLLDYQNSINTLFTYMHYELEFPNENVRILLPGNYIIKIIQDFDEDHVVLTKRFLVIEPQVTLEAIVKRSALPKYYKTGQEVDFTIYHNNYTIPNPMQELKVTVLQNFRWDNAIFNLKPLFIKPEELVYDYNMENVFPGGSEFRNFDMKSLRYISRYIQNVSLYEGNYHVELFSDEERPFAEYYYDEDINGRYIVENNEGYDKNIDADYVYVYFTLPMESPLLDGNIYVAGELAAWGYAPENQMKYNLKAKAYELTMLLKQGYYNYQYHFKKTGTHYGDTGFIEGNHYETENDYIILVYHRPLHSRYDKLIGMKIINSSLNRGW